ncbi:alpha/beta hydrolase family protein [Phreatobacter sp. AB_2022a]|uniref:alpha/beta hydrolase family protein n=1 Tax=Phreatobacter sp. AB_2022a TaxID=3003134 RepID=UPI0022874A0F|nr:alpha/beta hydrolase [Phreatobacter sp. AB_2022a]MCZ0735135.1 alpha/beta hydrolase [Phreatobacter sp. AB_2022a]
MTQDPTVPQDKLTAALQRAMPMTRLIDYGMDHADATELVSRSTEGEAWDAVAEAIGRRRLARAARAEAEGYRVTAAEQRAKGIAGLIFAQMAFNFDIPRKRALYRDLAEAGRQLCRISDPPLARIEVPFMDAALVGWLMRPSAKPARGTVIVFGGQSGWGLAYLPIALALAKRGLATLLAEGPGQGETRMTGGIRLDVDVPAAYQAFVSHILKDPALGPAGIWGNSYGGLWAAKTAARDPRIMACCVNGSFARPRLLPFRTAFEQSAAMLGTEDEDALNRNFERMRFDPATDRIGCPLLVLHGGADPLVQLADQQPFLDAVTGADRHLEVWPDGEHTIYNHGADRSALAADWFAARLGGTAGDAGSPDG